MRICFISNMNVGLGFSGGDRIFTELMKGWARHVSIQLMGAEEAIIISKRNGVVADFLRTSPLSTNTGLGLFSLFRHTCARVRSGIKGLKTFERETEDLDAVYSASDFYPDFLPAYLLKRRKPGIRWIAGYYLFAPAPWSKGTPYKGLHRLRGAVYWLMQRPSYYLVNRYADKVFVTSEPDVKYFVNKRRPRENVIVVQGGVDVAASEDFLRDPRHRAPNVVSSRRYDACFVGRLHWQKGALILIDIWKRVCEMRPAAKLAMIGNGPLERDLKAKIHALRLDQNIDMLGFLDGAEKHKVFMQSKIMVHPATYDSGGMAAAEGMAWRLPGVSFDLEALKTYYPQGMVKVPCFDTPLFAAAILRLLSDPSFYDEQAALAHDLIVTVWDWKKRAETIWQLLKL